MASVQKRLLKDGKTVSYVGRYRGPDGREHSRSFTLRRDAKAWVDANMTTVRTGDHVDPNGGKVTLAELMALAVKSASSGTATTRQFAANNLGPLAGVPIGKLTVPEMKTWMDELESGRSWENGKPLAPSSVRIVVSAVKAALNEAVTDGLLRRSPAATLKADRNVRQREVTRDVLLNARQIRAIAAEASYTASTMILVAAMTGLRPGEMCGLRRRSVDLQRAELHVREQATVKGNPWAWRPLKTPQSTRSVPLAAEALDLLAKYLQSTDGQDGDPLFLTRQGGMFTSTTFGEAFTNARDKAGLADFTPHSLRHFYASALIASNVNVRTVQARMGHATSAETLRTYTHLWPDDADITRAAVNDVFSSPAEPLQPTASGADLGKLLAADLRAQLKGLGVKLESRKNPAKSNEFPKLPSGRLLTPGDNTPNDTLSELPVAN